MNIDVELNDLIAKRKQMTEVDYNGELIQAMIGLLSQDVNETILFLKKDCSEEQFIWISEIFDEIAEKTKSKELIHALYSLCEKYPKATEQYNIRFFIESASEYL